MLQCLARLHSIYFCQPTCSESHLCLPWLQSTQGWTVICWPCLRLGCLGRGANCEDRCNCTSCTNPVSQKSVQHQYPIFSNFFRSHSGCCSKACRSLSALMTEISRDQHPHDKRRQSFRYAVPM